MVTKTTLGVLQIDQEKGLRERNRRNGRGRGREREREREKENMLKEERGRINRGEEERGSTSPGRTDLYIKTLARHSHQFPIAQNISRPCLRDWQAPSLLLAVPCRKRDDGPEGWRTAFKPTNDFTHETMGLKTFLFRS